MTEQVILALCSCPDDATARSIAEALVRECWAACVIRLGEGRSTYVWEGHLQDEAEILLMIKTTAARLAGLTERLKSLHPYQLPELIALPVVAGNEAYLDWVRQSVDNKGG